MNHANSSSVHGSSRAQYWTSDKVAESLAPVWRSLFNDASLQPLPGDDFFRLGGSSLLAMALVEKVKEVFGIELQMKALLTNATFGSLTAWIADKASAQAQVSRIKEDQTERERGTL